MRAFIFDIDLDRNEVMEFTKDGCYENCIENFDLLDFEYWLNETEVTEYWFRII